MQRQPLKVYASWDSEANVWWAESEDVPGLVAEESTLDALYRTVLELVPELLRLNRVGDDEGSAPVNFVVAEQAEHGRFRA